MFSADRARHLQNLFLSESWKGRFKALSDTTGFNLRIYSEDGNPIFSTEEYCPMCRGLLSAPDFRSKCDTYCHNTMMEAFSKCHPITYKCYAKIMSFAFPVEYMGDKVVILGQGSFPTYGDFREFIKHLSFSKVEIFPVTGPLKFTTAEDARNACSLVDSSIAQLLKNTQETITLKKKVDSLKKVLGMWGVASQEQPETLYKYMTANLFTLLDIKYIAIFSLDKERGSYKSLYSLKKNDRAAETFSISEHDIIVQELLKGKPFVSSMEPYMTGRVDFPEDTNVFYFFPILVNQRLEGILGIFDNQLKESDIAIINRFCTQTAISIENQRLHRKLYRKLDRFATVSDITKTLTPILNYETLLQTILDKSAELLRAEQGSLMLLDHETETLLLKAKRGMNDSITEKLRIQKGEGIAGKVAELGEPFLVEDVENDPRINQKNRLPYKTRSFVSVPITIQGRVIGVLNLSDKTTGEIFNKEDLELIQAFATQAAIVMERNVFYTQTKELRKLAITDPLTGLLNRRYLSERLEEELLRSQRHDRLLSLLMVDIDGFKGYNDTFGHPIGDKALKATAESILRSVRSVDIASRYGGDEFVIILPETGKTLAVSIAERLRSDVAEIKSLPGGLTLTISIGVASYPEDGKISELLLGNVDKALYLAKNRGGNRIEVFS
ncbi:MAG: diguanylate cyclase [Nitrospirae bacterium]|nr:diguanylate cyclase [Nitrospirota bacterium]MBI3376845.1 diguanylate cyclase [Nitrospirota bacterium]